LIAEIIIKDTLILQVVKPKVGNQNTALLLFLVVIKLEDGATEVDSFCIDRSNTSVKKLLDDTLLRCDI
jgi:hypothetical protein